MMGLQDRLKFCRRDVESRSEICDRCLDDAMVYVSSQAQGVHGHLVMCLTETVKIYSG